MENFDINLLGEALDFEELSKIPPAIFKKIQVFCDFYFEKAKTIKEHAQQLEVVLKTREKEWSDYSDELKTLRKDQQESYEAKIKTLNETNSSLSSQIEHPGSETFERHEEEIRRLSSINSELMKDMEVLKINEQKERIQRLQNQIVEQNEKIINIENDHDKLKLHYDKDINYLEEKVNALQTRNNIRKLTEEYDNALMVKMKIEAKSAQILLQAADHQIKGLVLEVQRLKGKLVLSESRILLLKCCCVSLQQNSANIDRKDQEVQTEVTFDLLSLDFLEDVNPSELWTPVPEENFQENDKQTEQAVLDPNKYQRSIDAKNHFCRHCHKNYSSKQYLNIHEKKHRGDLICDFCLASFVKKIDLQKHIKLHISVRTRRCSLCESTFSTNKYKNSHLISKHFQKLSCKFCTSKFSRKADYKKHVFTMHNDIESTAFNALVQKISKLKPMYDQRRYV